MTDRVPSSIRFGDRFDTAHENGCIVTAVPNEFGEFTARDSDGVECSYHISMITNIRPIERCVDCGMVANVDPWLHQERYGHAPRIQRGRVVLAHNGLGAFVPEAPAAKRNRARRERDQAMRDLGMVRVRGNLGGTYWE